MGERNMETLLDARVAVHHTGAATGADQKNAAGARRGQKCKCKDRIYTLVHRTEQGSPPV